MMIRYPWEDNTAVADSPQPNQPTEQAIQTMPWDDYSGVAPSQTMPWEDYGGGVAKAEPQSGLSKIGSAVASIFPEGIRRAASSGYAEGVTGLTTRLASGERGLPEDYSADGLFEKAVKIAGGLVSDLPAMLVGAKTGAAAGGATGALAGPAGAAVGGVAGGGFGAFAAPAAIKEALRQKLTTGEVSDYGSIAKDTAVQGGIGALTSLVGGGVFLKALAPEVRVAYKAAVASGDEALAQSILGAAQKAGQISKPMMNIVRPAAEIGTFTTAGAAAEGRMPTPEEYLLNAIPIAGMHLIGAGVRGIRGKAQPAEAGPTIEQPSSTEEQAQAKGTTTPPPFGLPGPEPSAAGEEAAGGGNGGGPGGGNGRPRPAANGGPTKQDAMKAKGWGFTFDEMSHWDADTWADILGGKYGRGKKASEAWRKANPKPEEAPTEPPAGQAAETGPMPEGVYKARSKEARDAQRAAAEAEAKAAEATTATKQPPPAEKTPEYPVAIITPEKEAAVQTTQESSISNRAKIRNIKGIYGDDLPADLRDFRGSNIDSFMEKYNTWRDEQKRLPAPVEPASSDNPIKDMADQAEPIKPKAATGKQYRVVPADIPLEETPDSWSIGGDNALRDAEIMKGRMEESTGGKVKYKIVEIDPKAVQDAGGKAQGKSPYGTGADWVKTDTELTSEAVKGEVGEDITVKEKVTNVLKSFDTHPQQVTWIAGKLNATPAEVKAAKDAILKNGKATTDLERNLAAMVASGEHNRHKPQKEVVPGESKSAAETQAGAGGTEVIPPAPTQKPALPSAPAEQATEKPKEGGKVFRNEEEGTEAHVVPYHKGGYSVALKDTDSGEFVLSAKVYPTEEQAIAEAKRIVEGKAPAPEPGKQAAQPGGEVPAKPERRKDTATRKRVDEMTAEEKDIALLTDELTGMRNLRAFREFEAENEKKPENERQLIGAVDLDNFKQINDNFGHGAGDEALKMFAEVVKRLGLQDFIYRTGGDEFSFRAFNEKMAEKITQALDKELAGVKIRVDHAGEPLVLQGISFSYGYGKNRKEADVRLYEHKTERTKAGERVPGAVRSRVRYEAEGRLRADSRGSEEGKSDLRVTREYTTGLAERLGKPNEVNTLESKGITDPDEQIRQIAQDILNTPTPPTAEQLRILKEADHPAINELLAAFEKKPTKQEALKEKIKAKRSIQESFDKGATVTLYNLLKSDKRTITRREVHQIAEVKQKQMTTAQMVEKLKKEGFKIGKVAAERVIPAKAEKPAGPPKSLVAWINNKGGMRVGKWAGEFREVQQANGKANFIRRKGEGLWGIDQLAQMAFDEGLVSDNEPETLLEALKDRNWKAPEAKEQLADQGRYGIINTERQQENERKVLERAREEGYGSLAEAAEAVSRRDEQAGRPSDEAPGSEEAQQREVTALKKWAKDSGLLIPPDKFNELWEQVNRRQGAEHQVIFDTDNTAIKRKIVWPGESYASYLHRLQVLDTLSPATETRLMGFSEVTDPKGKVWFMPVVRQQYIQGRDATQQEIDDFMHKAGFKGEGGIYRDEFSGLVVWDSGENNAKWIEGVGVVLFDPQINTAEEYAKRFKVTEKVKEGAKSKEPAEESFLQPQEMPKPKEQKPKDLKAAQASQGQDLFGAGQATIAEGKKTEKTGTKLTELEQAVEDEKDRKAAEGQGELLAEAKKAEKPTAAPTKAERVRAIVRAALGENPYIDSLAGPVNATVRQAIMSEILGVKASKSESGITALKSELFKMAGIDRNLMTLAAADEQLAAWVKGEVAKEKPKPLNMAVQARPEQEEEKTSLGFMGTGPAYDLLIRDLRTAKDAMPHLVKIGQGILSEGHTRLSDFKARMKEVLGDLWEKFKNLMLKVYQKAKAFNKAMGERGSFSTRDTEEGARAREKARGQREQARETAGAKGAFKTAMGAEEATKAYRTVKKGFIQSMRDIFRTFSPMSMGPNAEKVGLSMREHLAKMARAADKATEAMKASWKIFEKMNEKDRIDFMHGIEVPDSPEGQRIAADPNMRLIAKTLRKLLDETRDTVRGFGTNALKHYYENYFPHYWKDPEMAANFIQDWFAKRPFEGRKGFLKQRTFPTIKDGLDAGLELASTNPVDLVTMKLREMNKYIMAQRVIADMKGQGIFQFVKLGKKAPAGWAKIDDKISSVYYKNEKGETVLAGHYYAPKEGAEIINNYLSPGLRGKALFRGGMTISNILNQFQLGFSAFHLGFTSLDAAISKVALGFVKMSHGEFGAGLKSILEAPTAPFTNIRLGNRGYREWIMPGSSGTDIGRIMNALVKGGARAKQDSIYQTQITKNMMHAFRQGNILGGLVRAPFAAVEQVSRPIMEYIVPRQKLGVAMDLMKYELDRNPNMTAEELSRTAAKIWDSVDNRMGQLAYDNLFWNKTVKDLGMISVRSLGWNLGTFREVGGGVFDIGKQAMKLKKGERPDLTYRMSYTLALPVVSGMIGAVSQYLMTGKGPDETKDYFFPKTGTMDESGRPERVALPSYMKDLYHYYEKPGQTLINKLNPSFHLVAEMLQNKDFYGVKIRNEDDPTITQARDLALHALKGFEPFSSRGIRKEMKLEGSLNTKSLLPFVGITPAPADVNKTEAEKTMSEILARRVPVGARTKEKADEADLKRQLRRDLMRNGNAEQIRIAIAEHRITPREGRDLMRSRNESPLQHGFKQLGIEEALSVWKDATTEERKELKQQLMKKVSLLRNELPEHRAKLKDRLLSAIRGENG